MTHRWLVGILAGVLLAGSARRHKRKQKPAQAQVPTGEVVLGTVTIPRR